MTPWCSPASLPADYPGMLLTVQILSGQHIPRPNKQEDGDVSIEYWIWIINIDIGSTVKLWLAGD